MLGVTAVVESGDAVDVVVAAMTHGVAINAVAITMPAIAASCFVLVFILSSMVGNALDIYWISEMPPKSLLIRSKKRPRLGR